MTPAYQLSPGTYLAPGIDWLNGHFHALFATISWLVETILPGIEAALLFAPWYAMIAIVVVLAARLVDVTTAALAGFALGFCVVADFWNAAMQTIALVSVSVAISVLIASPSGSSLPA